jgi:hypothetical protein
VPDGGPVPSEVEAQLLWDLEHEDDQWLWEIVWRLNAEYPDVSLAEKVHLARTLVLKLEAEGRVELWDGVWTTGAIAPDQLGFDGSTSRR